MEESDEALLLACRRNDQAAWETLIARYQRLIYSIPRRAGLDAQQAADVFQQVFATLVEHLHRIEHPDRIGPWLVITARRETWRVSRGRIPAWTPVEHDDGESAAMEYADEGPLPDEVALRQERRHQVHQAMSALGDPCRTLLLMLFFRPEPPPYAQIAAALGTSEGSIGPTRARCLQKVARLLDESAP
ncbi:MAG TPA: sigma-70 family RNA polymerase sigma factor [Chloroflexota bacterium]|nr:sigma-70 family RNA polymerase sigma factor [Chloroflexota bacterium]